MCKKTKQESYRRLVLSLLILTVCLLAGCNADEPGASEPEVTPPADEPGVPTDPGGAVDPGQTATPGETPSKETPDDPMYGLNILTYELPGVYSLQYPDYWDLQGGEVASGHEILSLWKYDPSAAYSADGSQDPNSAKFFLSILPREGKSLDELMIEFIGTHEDDLVMEPVNIDGRRGLRCAYEDYDAFILTYLELPGEQYAGVVGFHGLGSEAETMERDLLYICDSLKFAEP
jgi:hypothetical protein